METKPAFSLHRLLSLALSLVILLAVMAVPVAADHNHDHNVDLDATYGKPIELAITGEANYKMAFEILDKVNAERKKENLKALEMDKTMLDYAMQRAAECALYYAHTRPNGESCFTIIKEHKGAGENIAAGYTSISHVMEGWMTSQGHRDNILTASYQSMGVGVFQVDGTYYWCQLFNGMKKQATATNKKAVTETRTIEARPSFLQLDVNHTQLTLNDGKTVSLLVKNGNKGFFNTEHLINQAGLTFTSAHTGVVQVSASGVLTPKANGKTTVKISSKNGVKLFSVSVTVTGMATSAQPVVITKEPAAVAYAKEGAKISIKITAMGENLKYTWYLKNAGATQYTKSSITAASYSTTMSDKVHGRIVYCVVSDQDGNTVQSKKFTLRRQATITKQPATIVYAQSGKKASVKITAAGEGLTYTWYFKNAGKKTFSKSSVKTSTYSTTINSTTKNRQIYCVVTDKFGKTVQSETFTLRQSVSITTQPKTVSVKKNATAKVTVKAAGEGLTYTWYYKNAGKKSFSKSSIKTASYSTKMTATTKNRQIYCVVKDKWGKTVKTVTVTLKMK